MKLLIVGLLAISVLCSMPVQAAEDGQKLPPLKAMQKPIFLDYGAFRLLGVTFNHSTHKSVKCRTCHHTRTEAGAVYAPCTTSGCHSIKGAREREPMSMFMAYHDPNTDRSCYGCHKKEAANHPQFKGCRPCHMSPMARQAAAENSVAEPASGQ